jgi:hypothetical protein
MLFSTVPAWFLVGAVISLVVWVIDYPMRISNVVVIFAITIVGGISAALAWMCMTSLSPYLVSTWVQGFFVAAVAIGIRAPFGDMKGTSLLIFFMSALVVFGVGIYTSAPLFNAAAYGRLVAVEIKERDATVPLIDQSQARTVTDKLALKRAAEILASATESGLGSRVVVGAPWGNKVGNTMYWIMPLEHSGFGKWKTHGTTPGYIAVSQTNEMVTEFVQNKPLKIGEEAWGDDNVYRHLFNRGFKNEIMGDAIFQVDDEWNPYWVVPMSLPQVGMGGDMPVSWSIVNAMTGDVQTYTNIDDVPAWVDRLFHQDMISERFSDWGCWSQGAWACFWSGTDVIVSTPGINVTIDASHDIVYYSGTQFQNNKSEGATSGFFIANARTGKITFYRRAGITEEVAKAVMNGAFADYDGYFAADNVLLSLSGREVYFSVIVDAAGSRKAYALVLQTNRNVFGKGNSIQAALTDFGRSLQRVERDASFSAGNIPSGKSFEGRVVTMTPVVQNERTSFYLTLDTVPGKIIEISEEKIGDIVVTKVGDRVRFTTDNDEPVVVFSTEFDNLGFTGKEGPAEVVESSAGSDDALLKAIEAMKMLTPEEIEAARQRLLKTMR